MPPKVKGKKGKKVDDDEYWYCSHLFICTLVHDVDRRSKAGESVAGNSATASLNVSDNEGITKKKKGAFDGFAALGINPSDVGMEDEEDFGGLMVRHLSSTYMYAPV